MFERIRSWLRIPLRERDAFENGMNEELRFHIEEYVEDLTRAGVSRDEAVRRAHIEFGSPNTIKEECRQARGLRFFDELTRNLRHSTRLLLNTPGFSLAAVIPFAFCLGANLTIFAVVDAVLLRPLPFPSPDRLVLLYKTYPKVGVERDGAAPANLYERRGRLSSLSAIAGTHTDTSIVGDTGSTVREEILRVSADFFTTLGVQPVLGRSFREEEMTYQTDRVAILSHAYWTEHFQSDPQAVGRQIRMDGVTRTIVGVLPPVFHYLSSEARIYTPYSSAQTERGPTQRHSGRGGELIARLGPGITIETAQAELDALDASIAHQYPQAAMIASAGYRTKIVNLHEDHVASVRPTLLLLQAGVFFLLLIGSVNLVNLLLIRVSARAKELAVRLALGASRWHIVGEVTAETTLLTTIGGALGLGLSILGIRLVAALGADHLPLGARIGLDTRLIIVALAVSVLAGIVIGFPVAWLSLRGRLNQALQGETRGGTASHAAQSLRHGFIVAQIALAFVLLSAAGLLGISLKEVATASLGFPSDHLLSGQISLPWNTYSQTPARLSFSEKLIAGIGSQPGVRAAGIVSDLPLNGRTPKSGVGIVNRPLQAGQLPRVPYAYSVGGDYFEAMQTPLREGRLLNAEDSWKSDRVCVVDELFARHFWPSGGSIGERVYLGSTNPRSELEAFTIVGVVGAVKQAELSESTSQGSVYFPFGHRSENNFYVVVRTAQSPESLGPLLQQTVRSINPDLPVYDVRSMDTRIADSLITRRAPAFLAGIFAATALLLAAVGTYGVLSYAVSQRRREIGVRMALGAQPAAIRRQFFLVGMRLLIAGTTVGLIGAWLAGSAMQKLLFNVSPLHVPILTTTTAVMLLATLAACLIPSHRAARISPIEALSE